MLFCYINSYHVLSHFRFIHKNLYKGEQSMRRKFFAFVIAVLFDTSAMIISMGQVVSTRNSNSFAHKEADSQILFCAIDNEDWNVKQETIDYWNE